MASPLTCPECAVTFEAAHHRQRFCTPAHQSRFHKVMALRGQLLLPLALASRGGTRKKGETGELQTWSRRHMTTLLDTWRKEDSHAGRSPDLVADHKMAQGWIPDDTLRAPRKAGRKPLTAPSV